jgi:hypothetical protein
MDIKVGDYVRIDNDFRIIALGIGKVIRTNQDTIYVKMNFEMPFSFKIEDITKHSKNIIDLIEVGDYVNGYRIDNIINGVLVNRAVGIDRSGALTPIVQYEQDIKTILTKERYMQNCYTVEGKEEWKKI